LAAFQALLARWTGQEDLLVGTPTAGRDRAAVAPVVGYLVNPVPLRADLSGDPGFAVLLGRLRRTLAADLAHRDLPFDLLVERLEPVRDPRRTPLLQAMLVHHRAHRLDSRGLTPFALGLPGAAVDLGGLSLALWPLPFRPAPFDLSLATCRLAGGIAAALDY